MINFHTFNIDDTKSTKKNIWAPPQNINMTSFWSKFCIFFKVPYLWNQWSQRKNFCTIGISEKIPIRYVISKNISGNMALAGIHLVSLL